MAGRGRRQIAALERHKTFLDFTQDRLGDDLLKIATDGCLENIIGEHAPDGTRWDDLSPEYAAYKAKHYGGRPMGVKDFLMAQPVEVAGETNVGPDEATVTYGVSDQAKEEMTWFENGDPAKNRPPRRFWGFTASSKDAAVKRVVERFKSIL
jgi:hypothetical protein